MSMSPTLKNREGNPLKQDYLFELAKGFMALHDAEQKASVESRNADVLSLFDSIVNAPFGDDSREISNRVKKLGTKLVTALQNNAVYQSRYQHVSFGEEAFVSDIVDAMAMYMVIGVFDTKK